MNLDTIGAGTTGQSHASLFSNQFKEVVAEIALFAQLGLISLTDGQKHKHSVPLKNEMLPHSQR